MYYVTPVDTYTLYFFLFRCYTDFSGSSKPPGIFLLFSFSWLWFIFQSFTCESETFDSGCAASPPKTVNMFTRQGSAAEDGCMKTETHACLEALTRLGFSF